MQFSILFLTFILQFRSAFAPHTIGWQSNDLIGTSNSPGKNNIKGYECGNDFFSDSEIYNALIIYYHYADQSRNSPSKYHAPQEYPNVQQHPNVPQEYNHQGQDGDDIWQYFDSEKLDTLVEFAAPQKVQHIQQQHFTPKQYRGPLYSDSEFSHYILWPIQKEEKNHSPTKYSSNAHYVVIEKHHSKIIDVISKTKNGFHTKCIKIDSPRKDLFTSATYKNVDYQCAHEFFSDESIQQSLLLARINAQKNTIYPLPYIGRLFPEHMNLWIWPLLSRAQLYNGISALVEPYFIVLDGQWHLIDVVVEGLAGNFLRCIPSDKISKIAPSDAISHSSKPWQLLLSGYICKWEFFKDNDLQKAAQAARRAAKKSSNMYRRLPEIYNGPYFEQRVYLWPIKPDGTIYTNGALGIFRLVLTIDFEIKSVVMVGVKNRQIVHVCEKGEKLLTV